MALELGIARRFQCSPAKVSFIRLIEVTRLSFGSRLVTNDNLVTCHEQHMPDCAECGAALADGSTCTEYLHELLALEAQVTGGPGELSHFLAVAAYNLQHPSMFAPAALTGLRTTFSDVLAGRATIEDARRRAGAGAEGGVRVIRRPDTPILPDEAAALRAWPTRWSVTVRDVCRVPPHEYADAVRHWATAVDAELRAS